jgi:ElaB/YqjD/DUF883 family membrane-anchored ribosome-binding protein
MAEQVLDQAGRTSPLYEQAQDQLGEAAAHVKEAAKVVGSEVAAGVGRGAEMVKEHPFATLAVAAGLAFAVGALWKIRSSSKQSRLDALLAQLPDRHALMPRRWR